MKLNTFAVLLLGLTLALFVFSQGVQTAQNKPFWNDEGFDIELLSKIQLTRVLIGKTGHPNNNPLYYSLQSLVINHINYFNENILIQLRLVSLLAGTLLILVLFFFVQKSFGLFWAFLVCFSLSHQTIFIQYIAESRHYALWLLCFTALIISTTHLSKKSFNQTTPFGRWSFALSALASTLVISLGILQVGAAIGACLFFWLFVHSCSARERISVFKFTLPLLALCLIIQLYYGFINPQVYGSFKHSNWDLLHQLKQGSYDSLKMPIRLLFPKPNRDAYAGIFLSNLFATFGLYGSSLLWKKRHTLTNKEKILFALNTVVLAQILVTIFIVGIIVYFHFYFVQRLFLYLIVCHALLALCGGIHLFHYLAASTHRFPRLSHVLQSKEIKICLCLFLFASSLVWNQRYFKRMMLPSPPTSSCTNPMGKLPPHLQKKPEILTKQVKLNFIVDVSRYLKDCSMEYRKPLFLWYNFEKFWYVTEGLPTEGTPMKWGNHPVLLKL